MPLYEFRCQTCQHQDGEYRKMGDFQQEEKCPKCGAHTYMKQVSLTHTDQVAFHTPIEMNSVGTIDPNEIRRLKKECPLANISDDPRDPLYGVPVAPSRAAKKQVLRAQGFVERN